MKSDMQLQRDIVEEIAWQPSIREDEISVTVKDGVVTLTGFVESYAQKMAAERAVERVSGVRALTDGLAVRVAGSHQRSDTELAHHAAEALSWNVELPPGAVRARVADGWLTLEGSVDWQFQREAAASAVRCLAGVRGVRNLVSLRPHASTYDVAQRIRDALRRSAELMAQQVAVETHDGAVTLRGSVRTWAQRQEVERAAWAAAGVHSVNDELTVAE